jgi:hypothetical protein
MRAPPFVPSPPLLTTARAHLDEAPGRALVAGAPGIAASLRRAGHEVATWDAPGPVLPESLRDGWAQADLLVLSGLLGGARIAPDDLRPLLAAARPGARVLLAEPSSPTPLGLRIGRLVGRILRRPLLVDPSDLAALGLRAGLADLDLTWPQGVRSLVLLSGRVHPLASTLA